MLRKSRAAWALAALCVLLFIAQFNWRPAPIELRMEMRTDQAARLLFVYRAGDSYLRQDYLVRMVESPKKFISVRFPIDQAKLAGCRLLQVDGESRVELRKIEVVRFGGAAIPITREQLKAVGGIKAITPLPDAIEILPDPGKFGTDLEFALDQPIEETSLARVLEWLPVALLLCASLALLWIIPPSQPSSARQPTRAAVIAALTAAYLIASLLGLNGSSSAVWRYYADHARPDAALLLGEVKHIRSDEWQVQTPWILSQIAHRPRFPLLNPAIGAGPATLLTSLPVRHWSIAFRPQYWGFFCLKLEQAFAFYWNFKWFALLLGAFLFFELFTGQNRLLALAGALFIYFSGFTQWWFSSPTAMPEMIGMFFLALWASVKIFRASLRWHALAASVLLLIAIEQFAFCCYPRFQIPLFYLGLFLALGALVRRQHWPDSIFRMALFGGTLCLAGILLFFWFGDVRASIAQIRTLVYPGQVFYTGGVFLWSWFAAPFLELGMTEHHFPRTMGNSCEAAGYLFVWPLLVAVVIRDALRRKFDPLLLVATAFATLLLFFMTVGIPASLARWTGFSNVAPTRANLALGLASAIGLFRYLARGDERPRSPLISIAIFSAGALLFYYLFGRANTAMLEFVGLTSIIAAAVFYALTLLFLWQGRVAISCFLLLAPLVYANGLTNPLAVGLPAFTRSPLLHRVRELHPRDPAGKWLVLGRSERSKILGPFLNATGAEVLGGVRINPDPEMIRVLDPAGEFQNVYQRYAHISFVPWRDPAPRFELVSTDVYSVHLPLGDDTIQRLGVRYILEIDLPEEEGRVAGFEKIRGQGDWRILRRAPR